MLLLLLPFVWYPLLRNSLQEFLDGTVTQLGKPSSPVGDLARNSNEDGEREGLGEDATARGTADGDAPGVSALDATQGAQDMNEVTTLVRETVLC